MDNKHLTASAGMMLTNGDIYVTEVWLGDWDSPDNWREVTKEEAYIASVPDNGDIPDNQIFGGVNNDHEIM